MDCSKFGARRLHKFVGLAGADRRLLGRALVMLVIVRLALWTIPFRRLQEMMARVGSRQDRTRRIRRVSARELAGAVRIAADYVPGATCLTRALVASALLRREGYSAVLRIGVTRGTGGKFAAHAWVECEGKVVIGRIDEFEQYSPLPPLEATAVDA